MLPEPKLNTITSGKNQQRSWHAVVGKYLSLPENANGTACCSIKWSDKSHGQRGLRLITEARFWPVTQPG